MTTILTVHKLPRLSLNVQIQRPIPRTKERRGCIRTYIKINKYTQKKKENLGREMSKSPRWRFALLLCSHVASSGGHGGTAHFTDLETKSCSKYPIR